MKIGFIGAGKVGCSLGMYFKSAGANVEGYFSRTLESAIFASSLTDSTCCENICDLIENSDIIFITVSDDNIQSVWDCISSYNLEGKIICHCSGVMSSKVFSNAEKLGVYAFSVHPLQAICDKGESYESLSTCYFTLEGNCEKIVAMKIFLESFGNIVNILDSECKDLYHCAAVFSSNFIDALINISKDILVNCGFNESNALEAISPLIRGNIDNILKNGTIEALTGPIERNDLTTVEKHLAVIEEYSDIYKLLSKELVKIGKLKNQDRNYDEITKKLNEK